MNPRTSSWFTITMTGSDSVTFMNYHLITIVFLLAAGASYAAGFAGGMFALLAIGLVLEGIFWIRLIRGRRDTG